MERTLQIGQVVKVLRGKDEGEYTVVIGLDEDRFAVIADGHKRRFDRPKRKNIQHLEQQAFISSEVADSIRETKRVTNAKLRFAIQKFIEWKGE